MTADALIAAVLAGCLSGIPVAAGTGTLPPVPDDVIARSVVPISFTGAVVPITLAGSVTDVAVKVDSGSSTVVRLSSDILFDFGKATLSPAARNRIGQLVGSVPRSATVGVSGYTDDVGSAASNLGLSRRRAQAVAGVVRSARPDLKLDVHGYGEADPVAPNSAGGKDDPAGRQQNRRVELRYRR